MSGDLCPYGHSMNDAYRQVGSDGYPRVRCRTCTLLRRRGIKLVPPRKPVKVKVKEECEEAVRWSYLRCDCGEGAGSVEELVRHTLVVHGRQPRGRERRPRVGGGDGGRQTEAASP